MEDKKYQERINNIKTDNLGQTLTSLIIKKEYGMIINILAIIVSLIIPSFSFIFLYKREIFNNMDIIKLIILIISINALSSSIFMFINYIIYIFKSSIERKSQLNRVKMKLIFKNEITDMASKLHEKNKKYIKECQKYLSESQQCNIKRCEKYLVKSEQLTDEIDLELNIIEKKTDKIEEEIFEKAITDTSYIQILISAFIWINYIIMVVFKTRYKSDEFVIFQILAMIITIFILNLIELLKIKIVNIKKTSNLKKELQVEI